MLNVQIIIKDRKVISLQLACSKSNSLKELQTNTFLNSISNPQDFKDFKMTIPSLKPFISSKTLQLCRNQSSNEAASTNLNDTFSLGSQARHQKPLHARYSCTTRYRCNVPVFGQFVQLIELAHHSDPCELTRCLGVSVDYILFLLSLLWAVVIFGSAVDGLAVGRHLQLIRLIIA